MAKKVKLPGRKPTPQEAKNLSHKIKAAKGEAESPPEKPINLDKRPTAALRIMKNSLVKQQKRNSKVATKSKAFSPTEKTKTMIGAKEFFKTPETAHIGNVMTDIHTHAENGNHVEASKAAELLHHHLFRAEAEHRHGMNNDYDDFHNHWEAKKEKISDKHRNALSDAVEHEYRTRKHLSTVLGTDKDRPMPGTFENRSARQHHSNAKENLKYVNSRLAKDLDNHEHEFNVAKAKKHNEYFLASKPFHAAHAMVAQHAPLHKVLNGLEQHPESYAHKSPEVKSIITSRAEDRLNDAIESGNEHKIDYVKQLHHRARMLAQPTHETESEVPKKKPGLFHRALRTLGLREAHLPEGVINAQEIILEFNAKVRSNMRNRRRTTASSRRGNHGPNLVKSSLSQLVKTRKKQMADRRKRAEEAQKGRELKQELQQTR